MLSNDGFDFAVGFYELEAYGRFLLILVDLSDASCECLLAVNSWKTASDADFKFHAIRLTELRQ